MPGWIPACELQEGFVPRRNRAVGVDHENRISQTLKGRHEQLRTRDQFALRSLQSTGPGNDDRHTGNEAHEGTSHDEQAGDIGLGLFRAQCRQTLCQQKPLTLDEHVAGAADLLHGRAARSGASQGKSGVAAIELVGRHGIAEPFELFGGKAAEFPDQQRRRRIGGGGHLKLAQAGLDVQARLLVGLESGRITGQKVALLAEFGALQGDDGVAHQRHGFVVPDHQALLPGGRVGMGNGEHGAGRYQDRNRQSDDQADRAPGE